MNHAGNLKKLEPKSWTQTALDHWLATVKHHRKYVSGQLEASEFVDSVNFAVLLDGLRTLVCNFVALPSDSKDFLLVNSKPDVLKESISLAANCVFFNSNARLEIRKRNLLPIFADALASENIDPAAKSGILRAISNMCIDKETSASILQCNRLLSNVLNVFPQFKPAVISTPPTLVITPKREMVIFSIRTVQLLSSLGREFCHRLLEDGTAFLIGGLLPKLQLQSDSKDIQKVVSCLTNLSNCDPLNCGRDLARSECAAVILDWYIQSRSEFESIYRFFFHHLLKSSSDMRVAFAKENLFEKIMILWSNSSMELADNERRDNTFLTEDRKEVLGILHLLSQEAFCRVKIRTAGVTELLVKGFYHSQFGSDTHHNLIISIVQFLFDSKSLDVFLKHPNFLSTIADDIRIYAKLNEFRCFCCVLKASEAKDVEQEEGDNEEADSYRPDSPNYVACLQETGLLRKLSHDAKSFPLAKKFCSGDFRYTSPFPSPGPSWSPGASSIDSYSNAVSPRSPILVDSPKENSCSPLGLSDGGFSRAPSGMDLTQILSPPCPPNAESQNGGSGSFSSFDVKDKTIEAELRFLGWLSHTDENLNKLAQPSLLSALIGYIAGVRDPNPRSGRILKRLVNRTVLVEELLDAKLHYMLTDMLCHRDCCRSRAALSSLCSAGGCALCTKRCKIGCDLFSAFGNQVDSGYGFGVLSHRLVSRDLRMRLEAAVAIPFLIRSVQNRKRLLRDRGGLNILMDAVRGSFDPADQILAIKSLLAFDTKEKDATGDIRTPWMCQRPCRFSEVLTNANTDDMITFRFSKPFTADICDTSTVVMVPKVVLAEASEYYRAMFSGSFRESTQDVFDVANEDGVVSERAFRYFLHFVVGCRNCSEIPTAGPAECLGLLSLAEKHLLPDLTDFVLSLLPTILNKQYVVRFLMAGFLTRNEKLTDVCFRFLLTKCSPSEVFNTFEQLKEKGVLGDCIRWLQGFLSSLEGL